MKSWPALITLILGSTLTASTAPIQVLVWDEQQPQQLQVYPHHLGNQIASYLRTIPSLEVKSANLNQPEQGLPEAALDHCQVLIWWGHVRNGEVDLKRAAGIVRRVQEGKLALIALHSAHWSEPFVQAMRERAFEDAMKSIPAEDRGKLATTTFQTPPRFGVPKRKDPITPSHELTTNPDGTKSLKIVLPNCVFPAFRPDGAPSHVTTLIPEHPIADGVPVHWDVPHTEMYDEPFHVPQPDFSVFEERWDKGEHFRSGSVWTVGKGKVMYFRPGHETFGVYLEPIPLRIVANTTLWLGGQITR